MAETYFRGRQTSHTKHRSTRNKYHTCSKHISKAVIRIRNAETKINSITKHTQLLVV